jgi:hypothetical protein
VQDVPQGDQQGAHAKGPGATKDRGAIAQLEERFHGMEEAGVSITPSSTKFHQAVEALLAMHLASNQGIASSILACRSKKYPCV